MPAPKEDGGWAKIPLSSDEAATIFRLHDVVDLGPGGGTRSFKPTVLSWMTKAGAPQGLQRLAGYHVEPGSKNPMEYGRDAMAPVLQYLDGLLAAIGHGLFDPDRTRSGRWGGCRSLDDALRRISDMAKPAVEVSTTMAAAPSRKPGSRVTAGNLPEPGDVAPSDGVPGPGPELEPDGGDSDVGPAQGDESSSCSLQDEEESDDADRMAELAGVRVAEAIDGEDSAQVGSFFRHVVSVFES